VVVSPSGVYIDLSIRLEFVALIIKLSTSPGCLGLSF
jgi:hypothetical protein